MSVERWLAPAPIRTCLPGLPAAEVLAPPRQESSQVRIGGLLVVVEPALDLLGHRRREPRSVLARVGADALEVQQELVMTLAVIVELRVLCALHRVLLCGEVLAQVLDQVVEELTHRTPVAARLHGIL